MNKIPQAMITDGKQQIIEVYLQLIKAPKIVTVRKPIAKPIWFINPNKFFLPAGATSAMKDGVIVEYKPIVIPVRPLKTNTIGLFCDKPSTIHTIIP